MQPNRTVVVIVAAVAALGLMSACGGASYGSAQNFKNIKTGGAASIFDTGPTPSAAAAIGEGQGPTPPSHSGGSAAQQQPAQQQTTRFPIKIDSDTSSQPGFVPGQATVYKGTVIVFTNADSKPRSVVSDPSDPAQFNSGLIAPGASWTWTASVTGTFGYSDGTRPYTTGSFTVLTH
jgi:plastocyanin